MYKINWIYFFILLHTDREHTVLPEHGVVIHSSSAAVTSLLLCSGGKASELHVGVDTMKWLIDHTGAGLIKIHRRGKTHIGSRGDKTFAPLFEALHKLYISIVCRPKAAHLSTTDPWLV